MGYDTSFSLRLVKGDPAEYDKFIEKLRKKSGYDGLCDGDCYDGEGIHWYDHEKDLKNVTKKFPDLIIEVNGVGEDYDDIWTERWQNGRSEGYGCIDNSSPFFLLATDEERRKRLDDIVQTAKHDLIMAVRILIDEVPDEAATTDDEGKRHVGTTVGTMDVDLTIDHPGKEEEEEPVSIRIDRDIAVPLSVMNVDSILAIAERLMELTKKKD